MDQPWRRRHALFNDRQAVMLYIAAHAGKDWRRSWLAVLRALLDEAEQEAARHPTDRSWSARCPGAHWQNAPVPPH